MTDSWPPATIDSVCLKVTSGGTPSRKVPAYFVSPSDGGTPWLKTKELDDGVVKHTEEHITEEAIRGSSAKLLPAGTVAMAMYGATVGKLGILGSPMTCNQAVCAMVVDPAKADYRFLYYSLLHNRDSIINLAVGSAQQNLSGQVIKDLQLPFPNLDEQRRIAGVLGTLDDLIEVNRKLATDCRELRQALVQSAMNDAVSSRPLSQLARFVNGKNFTKGATGSGRPVIRTPELRRGPVEGSIYSNATPGTDFIATAGDILFVWSGSLMVDRWVFEDGLVNQHIFKVISNGLPDWFIHGAIERQMPWFLGLAADKATTMGHIQRAHLDATVPVPSKEEMERLGEVAQPLWDQELQCALEIRELTSARDELLPLLMAGRVRVGDMAA